MCVRAVPGTHSEVDQTASSLMRHQVVAKELERPEQRVLSMRDQFDPAVRIHAALRRFHQLEIAGVAIRAHVEPVTKVIDVVLVVARSGQEHRECAGRIVGVQKPILARDCLMRPNQQITLRPALPHPAIERVIRLLVDHDVVRLSCAELVSVDTRPSQRGRVLVGIEQRPAVIGPDQITGDAGQRVVEMGAGHQVLDADRVNTSSLEVGCIGEQLLIRTDLAARDLAEVTPLGEFVDVEQDLL